MIALLFAFDKSLKTRPVERAPKREKLKVLNSPEKRAAKYAAPPINQELPVQSAKKGRYPPLPKSIENGAVSLYSPSIITPTKSSKKMQVRLIAVTAPLIQVENQTLSPEGLIAYCARVSSPHQETLDYQKLLAYCIEHKHWSIFEMVDMTVEIVTSRAISPQILRHKSFQFQEFSQRYAKAQEIERYQPRRQDSKNRQNSLDDLDAATKQWFDDAQDRIASASLELYNMALEKGIAKECARVLLPLGTQTKLYMKGSVRSWIHYLEVRTDSSTQQEHREIALGIKAMFMEQFPVTAAALGWK
jgi:thymidylate synthase (FAD)